MRPHNIHQQTVGGPWTKSYTRRMLLHAKTDQARRHVQQEGQPKPIPERNRLTHRPLEAFCKDLLERLEP